MEALIRPASQEWAYPDIEADYREHKDSWREVSESFYWQALEVMPPIYAGYGFMVSEPFTHDANGRPVYAGFVNVGNRFFSRYSTVSAFKGESVALRSFIAKATGG